MAHLIVFCNRCGSDLEATDRVCRCCGAETVEANTIAMLKRTSIRRSRREQEFENVEDIQFPL